VGILYSLFGVGTTFGSTIPALTHWIEFVYQGLNVTGRDYPFMSYGTDWLAFAHIVIAVAFIGPLRDPVKNIWVIEFGMIACALIIPTALIFGSLRGIPFFWQLIDCSFGVFGFATLYVARGWTRQLMAETRTASGVRSLRSA